jgi:hypothetical protein
VTGCNRSRRIRLSRVKVSQRRGSDSDFHGPSRLKIADIDIQRMAVPVEQGKGRR